MTMLLRRVALATPVAAVAAVLVWLLARAVDDPLVVALGSGTTAVPVAAVVISTVVGAVIALVLAAVARRVRRPRRFVVLVGVGGTLLSFAQPLLAAEHVSTAVWLCLMHVVVAAVLVTAVASATPERREVPAPSR